MAGSRRPTFFDTVVLDTAAEEIVRIITPKTYVNLLTNRYMSLPVIFLAGPDLGGGDWQAQMCRVIDIKLNRPWVAVVPCRWDSKHPLSVYFLRGEEARFPRQLNYERHYLEKAGYEPRPGAIIFWVAAESTEHPRVDGRSYARDTFREIAEWRGRKITNPHLRFVVGVDPNYEDRDGADVMKRNFDIVLGYDYPIFTSMDATAQAAINLLD